jgi:hypothetical protein
MVTDRGRRLHFKKNGGRKIMSVDKIHNILELIIGIAFMAGMVTATLNMTIAGFTPMIFFLISLQAVLVTICVEITTLREHYVGKK